MLKMQAIKIPDEYKEQIAGQVKVILLSEATPKRYKPLTAISISTKGFKFDRDEANER
ncbi:MAG: hypothetical protein LBV04_07435 [Deferribacteraceae bacterium]|jgi:hypothetical protein|nr:hypothetical protein [Deferribacteraceae bacterium]